MDLIICLCVYNNEQGLPRVLNNIKKVILLFKNTKIIAYYDSSHDNSLKLLQNSELDIEIIINDKPRESLKTLNICNARNAILKRIFELNPEYFIFMDSNEYSCVGDINVEIIQEILLCSSEWDSVSFNREAGYYDYWALSFDPYIYSFFHFNQNYQVTLVKMKYCFDEVLLTNKDLIPVYSAFNGFAIYKTEKFINCEYSISIDHSLFPKDIIIKQAGILSQSISSNTYNDCEHRHFHLQAINKNNARIRIYNKSLFNKLEGDNTHLRGPA